ncbi:hypothetical protein T07_3087 [Trichinella nelsoni]|uniref:Uncharacterized protein n=1 Tax=Trichinella nelsoni TaxID=6336 RepID=A0A0V0SKI9_9BILA|nr:hypothetical protein T07_3087 [Trichinella nelsoni]
MIDTRQERLKNKYSLLIASQLKCLFVISCHMNNALNTAEGTKCLDNITMKKRNRNYQLGDSLIKE